MRDNVSSQILVRWNPYFIFLTAKSGRTVIPSSFFLLIFVGLRVPWAKTERKLRWRSQNTGCLKSMAAHPKKQEGKNKQDHKKYCCSSVHSSENVVKWVLWLINNFRRYSEWLTSKQFSWNFSAHSEDYQSWLLKKDRAKLQSCLALMKNKICKCSWK